jgi:hypothetical protein
MDADWMLLATAFFAAINALLIGAVVTCTLISWGIL